MVGVGDPVLHFEELLAIDVRPAVFLTVDDAGLERAVDFLERHLLRVGAELVEHGHQHVGVLDTEFQAARIGGDQQRLVSRKLLHARMPERKPLQALVAHRIQEILTGRRGLETIDRVDVVEQEREVEDPQLRGVIFELRQRRGGHLDIAQQHGFEHLVVIVEHGVGVDLHAHAAVHFLVHAFLEEVGRDPLGVLVGIGDVAELDDLFARIAAAVCSNIAAAAFAAGRRIVIACAASGKGQCRNRGSVGENLQHPNSPIFSLSGTFAVLAIRGRGFAGSGQSLNRCVAKENDHVFALRLASDTFASWKV